MTGVQTCALPICRVARTFAVNRLRLEPPSTSILVTVKFWMMGDTTRGSVPTPTVLWLDHSRGFSGAGATAFSSRTSLLPALLEGGREAPP